MRMLKKPLKFWVEESPDPNNNFEYQLFLRVDWPNDRHMRVELIDDTPQSVLIALSELTELIVLDCKSRKLPDIEQLPPIEWLNYRRDIREKK